jgi:hypothetical protein
MKHLTFLFSFSTIIFVFNSQAKKVCVMNPYLVPYLGAADGLDHITLGLMLVLLIKKKSIKVEGE